MRTAEGVRAGIVAMKFRQRGMEQRSGRKMDAVRTELRL